MSGDGCETDKAITNVVLLAKMQNQCSYTVEAQVVEFKDFMFKSQLLQFADWVTSDTSCNFSELVSFSVK